MNLLKNNNRLLYLELSCRDVLCRADRNAHMFTARHNISTLLFANKNHEPLQNMLLNRDGTVFFNFWEGVKKTFLSVF
jgi:hypothetical protein